MHLHPPRRHKLLFTTLSLAAACGLTSCSLDAAPEYGMACDAEYIQLIQPETLQCYADTQDAPCPEYARYFQIGRCPTDAQYCDTDENGIRFCSPAEPNCASSLILNRSGEIVYAADNNNKYQFIFKSKRCPTDAPYCQTINDITFCSYVKDTCDASYIYSNGSFSEMNDEYKKFHTCPPNAPYCLGEFCSDKNVIDIAEYHGECPGAEYVFLSETGKHIQINDDSDYVSYLKKNQCPPDAPYCMRLSNESGNSINVLVSEEKRYCSDRLDRCENDAHIWLKDNKIVCETNSTMHCGSHEINCLDPYKGVEVAECMPSKDGMECKSTKCLPGFALLNGECLSGNQCCGPNCINCTSNANGNNVCYTLDGTNYECGDGCPQNYLQCNGVCVDPNTSMVYCGSTENPDGTCEMHYCPDMVPGWRRGECVSGKCQVWECLSGYHLTEDDAGIKNCEADTPESCGDDVIDCTQIAHQTTVNCRNGRCEVLKCESGYFAYDGECVKIDDAHCGTMDNICGDNQRCNEATELCECKTGFTDCDGACFDLTSNVQHCGGCDISCSVANADNRCDSSQCTFTCNDGFVPVSNRCESFVCETDAHKCENGKYYTCRDNSWSTSLPCVAPANGEATCSESTGCGIQCHSGYHIFGDTCETNTTSNCGAHDSVCSTASVANSLAVTCDSASGRCWATKCKAGYMLEDDLHKCMKEPVISGCIGQYDCLGDGSVCCQCAEACPNGQKKPQCLQVSCPELP